MDIVLNLSPFCTPAFTAVTLNRLELVQFSFNVKRLVVYMLGFIVVSSYEFTNIEMPKFHSK